ncbi:ribonuclease HII [Alkalihalobacillus xiaoxiensis]|uniref:Ribonuclease HII n=1 Tax=Shouchella xiaoxiensis TaxID=766895 RepID=A0ABS2SQ40_9BACI|nr:ribonuclease HII [Shouchella xiaoxiensis]MBM7837632.1 ribonuclease HII [Shouchella xiaoxiensis]
MQSIHALREQLVQHKFDQKELEELRKDDRKGVQALLNRYERQLEKERTLVTMHDDMWQFEQDLREKGYQFICGVDEVGRGPLAGPVTACACILPLDFKLLGLTDSKKLAKAKREEFANSIKEQSLAYHISSVSALEIDQINILEATKKAMQAAINGLELPVDYLLLDAITLPIPIGQMSLIKGDSKSLSIAASSVLAKVWRDDYMERLAESYPEYGFNDHAGYGTVKHLTAIEQHGVTKEHRRSFKPVMEKAAGLLYINDR